MFGGNHYAAASQLLKLPPHARKTYRFDRPSETHTRVVDCATAAEYGECKHYAEGFLIVLAPGMDVVGHCDRLRAAGYVFTTIDPPEGSTPGSVALFFREGQQCLASRQSPHRIPTDRPPVLSVVGGDWRGNPRGERLVHTSTDSWLNDFTAHQDRLARAQGGGTPVPSLPPKEGE
jgi:hypothetical protein